MTALVPLYAERIYTNTLYFFLGKIGGSSFFQINIVPFENIGKGVFCF